MTALTRTLLLFIALAAGFLAARPAAASCDVANPAKGIFAYPHLMESQAKFEDYEVRVYDAKDCGAVPVFADRSGLEILKHGKPVYRQTGWSFAIGYPYEQNQAPDSVKVKPGSDLTGDGVPDLLVSEWSGDGHCCYTFHLFQLGKKTFKKLQSLPLLDADESAFVKRKGTKSLVLYTSDYSAFSYFPSRFIGSPAGRVFLSYQGDRFRPDRALMRANRPAPGEVEKCAALFKKSRDWHNQEEQPMGMWYYATDLIYTGNPEPAWKFLDAAWGGSDSDKKKYLGEYRKRFTLSTYYSDLMLLPKTSVPKDAQKIDWNRHCFDYMHG